LFTFFISTLEKEVTETAGFDLANKLKMVSGESGEEKPGAPT
jgi:hypothetical protein